MANETGYTEDFDYEDDAAVSIPALLRHPFDVLRRHRGWTYTCFVLFLAITTGISINIPLEYEARATISLTAKSIPDEYVPTTVIASIVEQFETIQGEIFSRKRLSNIILETDLYAKERATQPLSELTIRLARELKVDQTLRQSSSRIAPHSVAYTVRMRGKDPEMLATVVNQSVAEMVNANIEYRSRQARVTTQFMQREFDRADEAVRSHQRQLAEFRTKNRGALPEEQVTVISKLERLEDQRRSAILHISDLETRLGRIRSRPDVLADDESFAAMLARLRNAQSIYTDDHPTVKSLERQVEEMRNSDYAESSPQERVEREEIATIEEAIALQKNRLSQIDEEVENLEEQISVAPVVAEQYGALLREDTILQENYLEYLRKLKNAELALSLESAQQGAQLTVLDSALPPTDPRFPRWAIASAGVVGSILAAVSVPFLLWLLFPVVVDEEHLESLVSIPCIGSISEMK